MSNKWRGFNGPITAELANAEPLDQQLFGPSYDRRQRQIRACAQREVIIARDPWRKPRIDRGTIRTQNSSERKGVDDRETA